jgi:hypothetical protein
LQLLRIFRKQTQSFIDTLLAKMATQAPVAVLALAPWVTQQQIELFVLIN